MSERDNFLKLLGKAISPPAPPKFGSTKRAKAVGYSGKRTRPRKTASASRKRSGKSHV